MLGIEEMPDKKETFTICKGAIYLDKAQIKVSLSLFFIQLKLKVSLAEKKS